LRTAAWFFQRVEWGLGGRDKLLLIAVRECGREREGERGVAGRWRQTEGKGPLA